MSSEVVVEFLTLKTVYGLERNLSSTQIHQLDAYKGFVLYKKLNLGGNLCRNIALVALDR